MKLRLLVCSVASITVTASGASADDWSVSVLGGHSIYPALTYDGGKASVKQGFNGGLRLAYGHRDWKPMSGLSLQLDVFYNQADLKGQTGARFDSLSYMGNLVYHVYTGTAFGLYGGAGVGGVRTEVSDPLAERNSTVFGWQALGGVDYQIAPKARLFVEYRYQNAHTANLTFVGGPVGNTSNNASVGIQLGL